MRSLQVRVISCGFDPIKPTVFMNHRIICRQEQVGHTSSSGRSCTWDVNAEGIADFAMKKLSNTPEDDDWVLLI